MIPKTPAGRRLVEWQKALGSGDPAVIGDFINNAVIEDFINKNMPLGRVQQHLSIQNQSGGYDVKRVEQSSDTKLVVLAQERGPAPQSASRWFNRRQTWRRRR